MSLGLSIQNIALIANARPWFSVEDYFDRADGALGTASDGRSTWTALTGTFTISDGKALAGASTPVATPADTGIAYVDILSIPVDSRPTESAPAAEKATLAPASNVLLEADVSPVGGDALYFRIKDTNNWHRVLLDTSIVTTPVYTGYTVYDWNSSLGSTTFVSPYKDPTKYFPTLTSCTNTTHDHTTVAASNSYITDFDPANRKWGKYPYIAVKRGIRQGDTGDDVKYLQGILKKYVNSNVVIDGDFGPQTDAALRTLQAREDIIVDGYAWNLQSWIVVDRLAFQSLATDIGTDVRGSESINSYVRRVLLGSTYNFPNKVVSGTSDVITPDDAYQNLVHSHNLLLDGCQHLAPLGTHIHYATNVYNGASTFVSTAASTTVSSNLYRVVVQKCVSGTITTLPVTTYNGYNNTDSVPVSHLKVVAYDNYVEVYINGETTPSMATWSAVANPLLSKHGFGRGASTAKGTGIDNFVCVPLEYFTIPSQ